MRAGKLRCSVRGVGGAGGFSLLEVVLVLVLVAAAGVGVAALRPHGALRAAAGVRAFLLWARLEAMWSGRAVAVTLAAEPGLEARGGAGTGAGDPCALPPPPLKTLRLRRFGRVKLIHGLRAGIVWLPSGGARSCDGGGVISDRLVLGDRSRRVDVVVSSLGRVRVEVER